MRSAAEYSDLAEKALDDAWRAAREGDPAEPAASLAEAQIFATLATAAATLETIYPRVIVDAGTRPLEPDTAERMKEYFGKARRGEIVDGEGPPPEA